MKKVVTKAFGPGFLTKQVEDLLHGETVYEIQTECGNTLTVSKKYLESLTVG